MQLRHDKGTRGRHAIKPWEGKRFCFLRRISKLSALKKWILKGHVRTARHLVITKQSHYHSIVLTKRARKTAAHISLPILIIAELWFWCLPFHHLKNQYEYAYNTNYTSSPYLAPERVPLPTSLFSPWIQSVLSFILVFILLLNDRSHPRGFFYFPHIWFISA